MPMMDEREFKELRDEIATKGSGSPEFYLLRVRAIYTDMMFGQDIVTPVQMADLAEEMAKVSHGKGDIDALDMCLEVIEDFAPENDPRREDVKTIRASLMNGGFGIFAMRA